MLECLYYIWYFGLIFSIIRKKERKIEYLEIGNKIIIEVVVKWDINEICVRVNKVEDN